jgi:hypothetical protein
MSSLFYNVIVFSKKGEFKYLFCFNSLTAMSVLTGTKNSRSEGFLLAKHKHTNIPTMMEPFSPPTAWIWWTHTAWGVGGLAHTFSMAAIERF